MKGKEYFVAHEFCKDKNDGLRRIIESAFKETEFKARYPDRITEAGFTLQRIKQDILSTEFGIYDVCSKKKNLAVNPNVIFELGVSIGAKKDSYVIVEKKKTKKVFDQISDLAGFDRIEYSSLHDLKEQIKKRIIPQYTVAKEFKTFWSPFIEEGGTIIVGVQTQHLDGDTTRNIMGEYDDIATSNLRSFLLSVAESSVVKSQKLRVKHLPMPLKVDKSKNSREMNKYITFIKETLKATDKNYILIGMQAVNPATEIVVSEIYGVKPFDPRSRKGLSSGYVINKPRRKTEFTFYKNDKGKDAGILDIKTDQVLAPFIKGKISCGIIIKANLWEKNFVILSGYNGIATVGAVEMLTKDNEEVDFINRNIGEKEFEKGILYRVRFRIDKEPNQPYSHTFMNASLIKDKIL